MYNMLCPPSGCKLYERAIIMPKNNVYIEQRDDGKYAVKRANAERASAVTDTQRAAIDEAKRMFPDVKPDIERVRHTKVGEPDQWRKE